jgi:hypothetical protein
VVVTVGLTEVEPVKDVEVKVPGVMARLVAPVTVQFRVLLEPGEMDVGVAVKELITGSGAPDALTVTVTVAVAEPALSVAVSV